MVVVVRYQSAERLIFTNYSNSEWCFKIKRCFKKKKLHLKSSFTPVHVVATYDVYKTLSWFLTMVHRMSDWKKNLCLKNDKHQLEDYISMISSEKTNLDLELDSFHSPGPIMWKLMFTYITFKGILSIIFWDWQNN